MTDARWEDLVRGALDGTLTSDEEVQLVRLLESDPAREAELLELLEQEALLETALDPSRQDESYLEQVRVRLRARDGRDYLEAVLQKVADPGGKDPRGVESTAPRREELIGPASMHRRRGSTIRRARAGRTGLAPYLAAASVLLLVGIGLVLSRGGERRSGGPKKQDGGKTVPHADRPSVAAGRSRAPAPTQRVRRPAPLEASPPAGRRSSPPYPAVLSEAPTPKVPAIPELPVKQPAPAAPIEVPAAVEPAGRGAPETAHVLARIARTSRGVLYARGAQGRWLKAVEGITLLGGDRLETRTGRALLETAGGGRVFVNHRSVLRLHEVASEGTYDILVALQRGEVCVVDEGGRKVHVETADGLFSPVGTRFNVNRSFSATVLTVAEGTVETRVKNRGARTGPRPEAARTHPIRPTAGGVAPAVGGGYQLRVRRGQVPRRPRRVDVRGVFGWTASLLVRETLLVEDFGDLPVGAALGAPRWRFPAGGTWRVRREGRTSFVRPEPPRPSRPRALAGDASWRGYTVQARVRLHAPSRPKSVACVAYWNGEPDRLYKLGVHGIAAGKPRLQISRGFDASTVILIQRPTRFTPGVWWVLKLEVRTAPAETRLRGKLWAVGQAEPRDWTVRATDASPQRLASGLAGLMVNQGSADFADLRVWHER